MVDLPRSDSDFGQPASFANGSHEAATRGRRFHEFTAEVPAKRMDPRRRLRWMKEQAENGDVADALPRTGSTRWRRFCDRWMPDSWKQSRVDPGRLGLVGLTVVGLVVLGVLLYGVWTNEPAAEPIPALPPPPPAKQPSSPPPEPMVVSVVGKVANPGLVEIEEGQRVADALEAAGGPLPGTDVMALNLARKLSDGEQLYVGVPPPPNTSAESGSDGAGQSAGESRIDLNTASEEELQELSGVGEVTAGSIVKWREEQGPFTSVDQLLEVDGIGSATLERLRDQVRS